MVEEKTQQKITAIFTIAAGIALLLGMTINSVLQTRIWILSINQIIAFGAIISGYLLWRK